MRRSVVLAAVLLAIGLTACDAAEDATDPDGVVTAENPAGTIAPDTMDQLYLSTVREGAPSFTDIDDATLIEFGQSVCTAFDNGATFTEIAAMGWDSGLDNIDLGYTMGVGVGAYCPEYTDELG